MAKKKTTRTRKSTKTTRTARASKAAKAPAPQHEVPSGFWPQVAAVLLMALSALLVVSWFGAGGPLLNQMLEVSKRTIGWAVYIVPVVGLYVAVRIFGAENNRLPAVMKFASILIVIWFSGLFGLFREKGAPSTGGVVGDGLNSVVLSLVNIPVGVFIYILLIAITLLFVLQLRFSDIAAMFKTAVASNEKAENEANVQVMRKAAEDDHGKMDDFKLNEGVPTVSQDDSKQSAKLKIKPQAKKAEADRDDKMAMLAVSDPNWQFPGLDLLEKKEAPADAGDIKQNARIIQDTLREFNINVDMEGANIGPKVTQYTLRPPAGIKLSKITALETNIALNLAASSLRMEAPIPGKKAVGIEVPNKKAADVRIRSILESAEWRRRKEPLSFAIGKDISGLPFVGELNKMPHLLVAGQTGSGKSVMINTLLSSLLYRNAPSDMKLILVDPKQVEMAPYQDIPHLLTPVIVEPEKTMSALKWAVNEMERRYSLLAEERVRDIKTYNERAKAKGKKIGVADEKGNVQQVDEGTMPYIVIVIDEMADLMMVAKRDVEGLIVRLAQKARAVGIHLVLATQRPSVDVITGLIKANVPSRIAFTVATKIDSRTILDAVGAESLLGKGDMLYSPQGSTELIRIHGAFMSDDEVVRVVDDWKARGKPNYIDGILDGNDENESDSERNLDRSGEIDELFDEVVDFVVSTGTTSISAIQRRFRVGFNRAANIMDQLEEQGIVSAAQNGKREVLARSSEY